MEFDGGYGNKGVIKVDAPTVYKMYDGQGKVVDTETECCRKCGADNVPLLSMDGSEGEYGIGALCIECTLKLFTEYAVASEDCTDFQYVAACIRNNTL